jgi:hypothetical protein
MFQNIKESKSSIRLGRIGIQVDFASGVASYARYGQSKNKNYLKVA